MPTEVILPKVDMDMATGRISRWYKAEGDAVAKGELLFEIETDKATMEIDAPAGGVLRRVTGREGVDIPVGEPVAWIYAEGEVVETSEAAAPAPAAMAEEAAQVPAPAAEAKPVAEEAAPESGGNKLRATPLARRLARQYAIDLSGLSGSGPRGRIQAKDVEGAQSRSEPVSAKATIAPAQVPAEPRAPHPASTVSGAQRVSAGASTWLRQEGEGVPLVLIHGFGSEGASWRPFLSAFERPMPILSIELPGHGAAVDVPAVSFDDLVAHAETELAAHGVTVAHLAGHSLGGAVATALAAGSTVEARSLFLLAPAGLGPDINTGFTQGFAAARDEAPLRAWMNELVSDPATFSDSFVKATLRARGDGRLPDAQSRLGPLLFSDGTQRFSVRALLDRLAVRTKVVAGSADRIVPVRQMSGLPGSIALHVFAGLGHMPHLEDRMAVARLLDELVR